MNHSRSRAKLSDIATATGYSLTTVSHAFTGNRPVAAATRRAIFEVGLRIGYIHEPSPRGTNIGVLLRPPEALQGFAYGTSSFAHLTGAITLAALSRGYTVSCMMELAEVQNQASGISAFILLHPNHNDKVLRYLTSRQIPAVTFDPAPGMEEGTWIGVDYGAAIATLVDKMFHSGATRICLLLGSTDNSYSRELTTTYIQRMQKLKAKPSISKLALDQTIDFTFHTQLRDFMEKRAPDGLITSSAVIAEHALTAALNLGLQVPRDIQIASVMEGERAVLARQPITACYPETNRLGHELLRLVDAQLRNQVAPGSNERFGLHLIERSTTKFLDGPGRTTISGLTS